MKRIYHFLFPSSLFPLFFFLCSLLSAPCSFGVDYGALLKMEFDVDGADKTSASGNIIVAPWLSMPFNNAELFVSAGLNTHIAPEQGSAGRSSADSYLALEVFRLEYSMRLSSLFSFRVGRFNWQDPSGLIAKGRFDGVDTLFDLGKIRLSVNALYTGFLFNDTADINVSPADTTDYAAFKWDDYATYFAPRRLMASVYGEFPGFPVGRGHFYAGLTTQFDLSDSGEAYHTQYLLLRHTLAINAFDITAAGAAELSKTKADGIKPAFALSLEGGWLTPTTITDRLSLGLEWASGNGPATAAFFPITREAKSFVLEPCLSGIMIIKANYKARILPSLSADAGCSYFIRTDSTSFTAAHLEDKSYPLGLELDAGALWVPFSDLSFTFRGGVFLPKTGSAWADDAPTLWRINFGTIFSF